VISVLTGTGGGAFAAKTDYAMGTRPESVEIRGFDLVVANHEVNTASVLPSQCVP
jgi:hypothetical protein